MTPSRVSISNVSKAFVSSTSGERLTVLDDLNIEIRDNELICLLGPSGCGKSTLLNLIAGLDTDFTGHIAIDGKQVKGGKPPVRISYIFQEPRLLPWLTAEENVEFVLTTARTPRSRWSELKDRYFHLVGLNEFRSYYPHQMSGGMCQRLSLVRALSVEPDILLMDEPFSGLDEITAKRIRIDLLRVWRETRKTIVFVTHNSFEASFLADRILVMSRGRIRQEVAVNVTRPRDYEDVEIFHVSRNVSRIFAQTAEASTNVAEAPTEGNVTTENRG
jgi:NitT/TauT family transport system ATP-binding protein